MILEKELENAEKQKDEKDKNLTEINSKIEDIMKAQKDYETEVLKEQEKAEQTK